MQTLCTTKCSTQQTLFGNDAEQKYLQAGVFPHAQSPHPHVCQEHLAAGVSNEVPVFSCHSQLQAGRITPVFQFIGQQFHGNLLIMFIGLIQDFNSQLAKISGRYTIRSVKFDLETSLFWGFSSVHWASCLSTHMYSDKNN